MSHLLVLQTLVTKKITIVSKSNSEPTINQRIRDVEFFAKKEGVSSFPKYIGVSSGQYGNVVGERKSKPGVGLIKAILRVFPTLNPRWLLLGEGSMWIGENKEENTINEKKELEILRGRIAELEKLLTGKGEIWNDSNIEESSKDEKRIFEMMIGRMAEIEMSFEHFEKYKDKTDKELSKLRYIVRKLREERDTNNVNT